VPDWWPFSNDRLQDVNRAIQLLTNRGVWIRWGVWMAGFVMILVAVAIFLKGTITGAVTGVVKEAVA
jgi:hypothetical protein